jgi:hypothetical protein
MTRPTKRNPVARTAHQFNRCRVMRDRKAAMKRGERQKYRRLDVPIGRPLRISRRG